MNTLRSHRFLLALLSGCLILLLTACGSKQHNSSNGQTQSLLLGSMNGGMPTTFASISGTQSSIVGWTTV